MQIAIARNQAHSQTGLTHLCTTRPKVGLLIGPFPPLYDLVDL